MKRLTIYIYLIFVVNIVHAQTKQFTILSSISDKSNEKIKDGDKYTTDVTQFSIIPELNFETGDYRYLGLGLGYSKISSSSDDKYYDKRSNKASIFHFRVSHKRGVDLTDKLILYSKFVLSYDFGKIKQEPNYSDDKDIKMKSINPFITVQLEYEITENIGFIVSFGELYYKSTDYSQDDNSNSYESFGLKTNLNSLNFGVLINLY